MYIKLYIICKQLEQKVKYNTFNIYWEISVLYIYNEPHFTNYSNNKLTINSLTVLSNRLTNTFINTYIVKGI